MNTLNRRISEQDRVMSCRYTLETELAHLIGERLFKAFCLECFEKSWEAKEVRVRYFFDDYCAENAPVFREAIGDLVDWEVLSVPKISLLLTEEQLRNAMDLAWAQSITNHNGAQGNDDIYVFYRDVKDAIWKKGVY